MVGLETRLELSEAAVPENVRPIRRRVTEVAVESGAEQLEAEEVGLCVGEAVANAVRHAYVGETGPVGVLVQVDDDEHELVVIVRDHGRGMQGRGDSSGFGLLIIERLTRDVSIASEPDRGTVIRMSFPLGAARPAGTRTASRGAT